jgi:hypothetical protein
LIRAANAVLKAQESTLLRVVTKQDQVVYGKKSRRLASVQNREPGRNVGVRWHDDFVARPDGPGTWTYVPSNLLLVKAQFTTPGVFENLHYKVLNGPLWTLAYEVFCYVLLFAAGWLGLLRRERFPYAWLVAYCDFDLIDTKDARKTSTRALVDIVRDPQHARGALQRAVDRLDVPAHAQACRSGGIANKSAGAPI